MLNDIWIVKKGVGLCIFHQKYSGKEIDSDLFSGFLSGIYSFSEEISETGGIETMELRDIRLLYGVASDLIYIIAATKDEEIDGLRKKLSEISKTFLEKYGKFLVDWDGNISLFEPFKRDLDAIIEERKRPLEKIPFKLPAMKNLKFSQEEFQVLSLCDGKTAPSIIASKLCMTSYQLCEILNNLEKKKLIQRKWI